MDDQGNPYRAGAEVAQLPHDDMGVVAAEDGEAVSPFRSGNSAGLPDSSEVPASSGQPAPPGAAANDGGSRGDGEGASLGGRQVSVAEDRAGPAEGTTGPPDSTSSITGALARTSLSPLVVPSNSELPGSMLHPAAPALGSPLKKGLQGSPRRGALGLPQSSAPVRTLSGLSSHELHAASYASTRPSVTVVRAMSGGLEQRIPILSRLPTKDFGAHPLFCNKLRHTRLVCKVRGVSNSSAALVSNWRMKSKMKTVSVALLLCLNIGYDPPDVIKLAPCARLECWTDPYGQQPQKAMREIGDKLIDQYQRWQGRARVKLYKDPTVDEARKACASCRRHARQERALFHYNGHGVPRPTPNGEIWMFNSSYTQYIPLSVDDLQVWLGNPAIYVFDCSGAGVIVQKFLQFAKQRRESARSDSVNQDPEGLRARQNQEAMSEEHILLAACQAHERLPQQEMLPADVFTACLTTPITIALRWFLSRSLLGGEGLTPEMIDKIPGRLGDRKTPLGELNWIYTGITDTIAWNVMPRELFQKLFRQDLLVASLFRNFLMADRIMRTVNCTPVSHPQLPDTFSHPMWHAWDLATERCLAQLPRLLDGSATKFQPSTFFTEQLTAFEVWLQHGSRSSPPPEQLPIVLQVLLSQSHRLRALQLLAQFLDMGPWAVDLALSVGIFPYVLKLLQTTAAELQSLLVFIWAKILALDYTCQTDLIKADSQLYFITFLDSYAAEDEKAMAMFVLSMTCYRYPKGQYACLTSNILQEILKCLDAETHLLQMWSLLCLGRLWNSFQEAVSIGFKQRAREAICRFLDSDVVELRAAAVFAIGCAISLPVEDQEHTPGEGERLQQARRKATELKFASMLVNMSWDASPMVRLEVSVALSRLLVSHEESFREAKAILAEDGGEGNGLGTLSPGSLRSRGSAIDNPIAAQNYDSGTLSDTDPDLYDSEREFKQAALLEKANEGLNEESEMHVYSVLLDRINTLCADPSPRVAFVSRDALRAVDLEVPQRGGINIVSSTTTTDAFAGKSHRGSSPGLWSSPIFSWKNKSSLPLSANAHSAASASPPSGIVRMRGRDSHSRLFSASSKTQRAPYGSHGSHSPSESLLGSEKAPGSRFRSEGSSTTPQDRDELEHAGCGSTLESDLYGWAVAQWSRPILASGAHAIMLPPDQAEEDLIEFRARTGSGNPVVGHQPVTLLTAEARSEIVVRGVTECRMQKTSPMSEPLGSVELGSACTSLHFNSFVPHLYLGDAMGHISIWDYESNASVGSMHVDESHRGTPTHTPYPVEVLSLNELGHPVLLAGCSDGTVVLWRAQAHEADYHHASAFRAHYADRPIPMLRGQMPFAESFTQRPPICLTLQAGSGHLYTFGEDLDPIRQWDLEQERCVSEVATEYARGVCSLSSHVLGGATLAAGCVNGQLKFFDTRARNSFCGSCKPFGAPLLKLYVQPSGSQDKVRIDRLD